MNLDFFRDAWKSDSLDMWEVGVLSMECSKECESKQKEKWAIVQKM